MSEERIQRALTALHRGRDEAIAGRNAAAAESFRKAAALEPDDAKVQLRAGEGLGNLGLVEEAEACFMAALARNPVLHLARFNLALAKLARGVPDEAAPLLSEVVRARPDVAPAWLHLGGALNAQGQYQEAGEALSRYLQAVPQDPVGLTWMGASLQFRGHFDDAERYYRAALASDPEFSDAHANLGKLLQAQGKPGVAAEHFHRVLTVNPAHPQALSGMAAWLDNEGRQQEAIELLDRSGLPRDHPDLVPIRARALRKLDRASEARDLLESTLLQPALPSESQVQLRFSLAATCDQLEEFAIAWKVATEANRLKRASFPDRVPGTDLEAMSVAVTDLEKAFAPASMENLMRSGCESECPVFIVGMPRAGKSLAEQIVCSHGCVSGAGELTAMGEISAALERRTGAWPEGAARVTRTDLDEMAAVYLGQLTADAPDEVGRVTDTMPFNFVHLGLIEMLFPRSRVIHCVRHPMDLVLRCYFKNFAGRSLRFAFSLEDLVHYYGLYRRLMGHWMRVSGLSTYILRYESLIEDTAGETRRLIDFLGLDWEPRCLEFYNAGVATSAAQTPIRRPLNDREVARWKHYSDQLGVAAESLHVAEYESGGF
ncbi:MAG: sulfotransferase [Gammaproteobacteria bacterium]|nr:MAG: sulfotransferase [Gammaproteobacteria bacterium]